jgi:hypothetical protein
MLLLDQGVNEDWTAAVVVRGRVKLQRVGVLQKFDESLWKLF